MTQWSKKLLENLNTPFKTKVFYFASTEETLVNNAVKTVRDKLLSSAKCDFMQLNKDFEIAELYEISQTISFFEGWRVIELKEINPASFSDKQIKEMVALFSNLENTILILTTIYADKKSASGKRLKALFSAVQKTGFAAEISKPTQRETMGYIMQCAKDIGAEIEQDATYQLVERAGEDWLTLQNEVEKLAAMVNYSLITKQLVQENSISTVDADVFELARFITARKKSSAFEKVDALLANRIEPLAIVAALSGTFVDMYRVRCGTRQGLAVGAVFKEMGYFGSEYRLQKAKESAMKYTEKQLELCILCLALLDKQLKSSSISNKNVLLETAVANLIYIGESK